MKLNQLTLAILLLIQFHSFSQKLSKEIKDSLHIVLDEMGTQDQKHRWELMYGTNNTTKIDSINKLPVEEIKKIIKEHNQNHKKQIDTLWVLQNRIDSINREKLISLINKFGFPSPKRVKSRTTTYLLLHFTSDEDFKLLNPILIKELKTGNMPGQIYAEWFDRRLHDSGQNQLYGAYNSKYPCVANLEKTNIERKNIGLKKLKENNCR
tara:strand:+ start:167 stop:793 length:627 start_codon:yes stop_codon:yes gene_type:complete